MTRLQMVKLLDRAIDESFKIQKGSPEGVAARAKIRAIQADLRSKHNLATAIKDFRKYFPGVAEIENLLDGLENQIFRR